MTSTVEALQQQLRDDPSDWNTWLVYADWLTERGDPRGQLIVLEHRRAMLAVEPLDPTQLRKIRALDRETRLLEGKKAWRRKLIYYEAMRWIDWQHGFVRMATFRGPNALAALEELFAQGEGWWLHTLTIPGSVGLISALLGTNNRISSLELSPLYGDPNSHKLGALDIAALASSSSMSSLTDLDLANNGVGDAGVEAIASSKVLCGLIRLGLMGNNISDRGVKALAESKNLRALTSLDLRDNWISREAVSLLRTRGNLPALMNLSTHLSEGF